MSSGYNDFFKSARNARVAISGDPKIIRKASPSPQKKKKATSSDKTIEQLLQRTMLKKKPKNSTSLKTVLLLALGLSGSSVLYLYEDEAQSFLDKLEISFLGGAMAETPANAAKPADGKQEIEKTENEKTDKTKSAESETAPNDEEIAYFSKLRDRKKELDNRELELKKVEDELAKQRVELDKKIQELEEMRRSISSILKDKVEVDNEKVEKLVKIYSKMKPQKAAEAISKIDQSLAVEILGRLNEKAAAEILNLIETDKSKILSELYSGYRRN